MVKNNKNCYYGAFHIHSKFSDGTGDIDLITKDAKRAGLDWIIITDHNNCNIEEGFINGICAIKGVEFSPENYDHYIALDINDFKNENTSTASFALELKNKGGFGFAAHPDESKTRKNKHKPIRFDKNITPQGIEIWNWFSTWADNLDDRNIFSIAWAYFFKHGLITKPKEETLLWWDELNNKQKEIIPAIGALDTHAFKIKKYIIPITVFPYYTLFKTITNKITLDGKLSNNFLVAKKQILEALKKGNNLIYNRKILKEPPEIYIANGNLEAFCGEIVNFNEKTYINISLKKMLEVKLLCDGKIIYTGKIKELKFPLMHKGKYRLEAEYKGLGCVYSNPILVE